MKKYVFVSIMLLLFVCGCTNVNELSYDEVVDKVLSNDVSKPNTAFKGYKLYLPKDMTLLNDSSSNNVLYSNNDKYYLYVDLVSYYNKVNNEYKINDDKEVVYSKLLNDSGKNGYILVTKHKSEYFIEVMYNYAKIEVISPSVNSAVSKSLIVLKSIVYNDSVVSVLLEDSIDYNEEKFELLGPSVNTDKFLEYVTEFGTYEGDEESVDEDVIEIKPSN
jgi:hypothetical protein